MEFYFVFSVGTLSRAIVFTLVGHNDLYFTIDFILQFEEYLMDECHTFG